MNVEFQNTARGFLLVAALGILVPFGQRRAGAQGNNYLDPTEFLLSGFDGDVNATDFADGVSSDEDLFDFAADTEVTDFFSDTSGGNGDLISAAPPGTEDNAIADAGFIDQSMDMPDSDQRITAEVFHHRHEIKRQEGHSIDRPTPVPAPSALILAIIGLGVTAWFRPKTAHALAPKCE